MSERSGTASVAAAKAADKIVRPRCIAIGCGAEADAGVPMCTRHWSATAPALRQDVLAKIAGGEITLDSRLVHAPDGSAIVDVRGRPA